MAVGEQPGKATTTLDSLRATQARIEATLAKSRAVSADTDELNAKWTHYKGMMDEMNAAMLSKLREKLGIGGPPLREGVVVPVETMAQVLHRSKKVVVLTGAGISVESGIPAYRTPDGCWTVGSVNYRPTETATFKHFDEHPEEHWRRLHEKWSEHGWKAGTAAEAAVQPFHGGPATFESAAAEETTTGGALAAGGTAVAQPNAGHAAVVELERLCKGRPGGSFHLLTQNIDGLHLDAGSSPETTFQVHGTMRLMRCDESQPGSCAAESGLLRRTAAFLKAEHGSLRAAFARFADGGERLTEAQLARGLAASGVDLQAAAPAIAGIFAAVRVKGVLEGAEEEYATPASFTTLERAVFPLFGGEEWSAERIAADPVPRCPRCRCRCRPEVLWFDETYDETHFRADSAREAAAAADCLLVVGTTLTTGLPSKVVRMAHERGIPVLNVDPGTLSEPRKGMLNLPRKSGAALPELAAALRALQAEPALPPPRSPAPAKKRAAAAVSSTRQAAKSSRANVVGLPGALASKRRPSDSSTRASTPEAPERVFLCGAGAPWGEGAPALLRGASLYGSSAGVDLVLEQTAMAVRGVLTAADSPAVPAGAERSRVLVDVLDPADPSAPPRGQEWAWAYHPPAARVDRGKAAVVPDGDARSWRPAGAS